MMDWGTTAQWGGVLLSMAAIVIAWVNRRTDAIKNVEDRLDRHDARISKVETEVAHLPSKDLTTRIELSLMELNGRLNTLSATLTPVSKISDRLQEFLLEQAARK